MPTVLIERGGGDRWVKRRGDGGIASVPTIVAPRVLELLDENARATRQVTANAVHRVQPIGSLARIRLLGVAPTCGFRDDCLIDDSRTRIDTADGLSRCEETIIEEEVMSTIAEAETIRIKRHELLMYPLGIAVVQSLARGPWAIAIGDGRSRARP